MCYCTAHCCKLAPETWESAGSHSASRISVPEKQNVLTSTRAVLGRDERERERAKKERGKKKGRRVTAWMLFSKRDQPPDKMRSEWKGWRQRHFTACRTFTLKEPVRPSRLQQQPLQSGSLVVIYDTELNKIVQIFEKGTVKVSLCVLDDQSEEEQSFWFTVRKSSKRQKCLRLTSRSHGTKTTKKKSFFFCGRTVSEVLLRPRMPVRTLWFIHFCSACCSKSANNVQWHSGGCCNWLWNEDWQVAAITRWI